MGIFSWLFTPVPAPNRPWEGSQEVIVEEPPTPDVVETSPNVVETFLTTVPERLVELQRKVDEEWKQDRESWSCEVSRKVELLFITTIRGGQKLECPVGVGQIAEIRLKTGNPPGLTCIDWRWVEGDETVTVYWPDQYHYRTQRGDPENLWYRLGYDWTYMLRSRVERGWIQEVPTYARDDSVLLVGIDPPFLVPHGRGEELRQKIIDAITHAA